MLLRGKPRFCNEVQSNCGRRRERGPRGIIHALETRRARNTREKSADEAGNGTQISISHFRRLTEENKTATL